MPFVFINLSFRLVIFYKRKYGQDQTALSWFKSIFYMVCTFNIIIVLSSSITFQEWSYVRVIWQCELKLRIHTEYCMANVFDSFSKFKVVTSWISCRIVSFKRSACSEQLFVCVENSFSSYIFFHNKCVHSLKRTQLDNFHVLLYLKNFVLWARFNFSGNGSWKMFRSGAMCVVQFSLSVFSPHDTHQY